MSQSSRSGYQAAAARQRRVYSVLSRPARLLLGGLVTLTMEGAERVPRHGPLLLMGNHQAFLDPLLISLGAGRPVQFLGTEAALRRGVLARFLRLVGTIPKRKLLADARAVRVLKRWCEASGAVGQFPEGQVSWDGRDMPLVPGIGRLVRLLDVPVVIVRIHNAGRQWPRWARVPRRGRIHLEFDRPRRFERSDSPGEIQAWIESRLWPDRSVSAGWTVRGVALARGLSALLFACPGCGELDALDERGSAVQCRSCGAAWTVDTHNLLHPRAGGEPLSIPDAWDAVRLAWARRGWGGEHLDGSGELLSSRGRVEVLDMGGEQPGRVALGRMVLRPRELAVEGPVPWRLPLERVVAISTEVRNGLWFRTRDTIYQPLLGGESIVKWACFAEHWRRLAAGRSLATARDATMLHLEPPGDTRQESRP